MGQANVRIWEDWFEPIDPNIPMWYDLYDDED